VKTRLLHPPVGIGEAVDVLRTGGLAGLPTETVYGLAANALDPVAVASIFSAKERPLSDPLIVHLPGIGWLERLSRAVPLAFVLARRFWPGPLTVVVPRSDLVPDLLTAGQDSVALRMSSHPLFQSVIERLDLPLAAPSANRFGRISPTSAAHVLEELDGRIHAVLDGGPCLHGVESTIVEIEGERLRILRHGPVTAEELAGSAPLDPASSATLAPGGLKSHYAPRTRLIIEANPKPHPPRRGLLAWSRDPGGFAAVEILSPGGDVREAAANLYGAMRRLDAAGLDLIVAEPVPESGIGKAVMERLRKAAA
jgi:L-threonylcarbamoyladenylate synthase